MSKEKQIISTTDLNIETIEYQNQMREQLKDASKEDILELTLSLIGKVGELNAKNAEIVEVNNHITEEKIKVINANEVITNEFLDMQIKYNQNIEIVKQMTKDNADMAQQLIVMSNENINLNFKLNNTIFEHQTYVEENSSLPVEQYVKKEAEKFVDVQDLIVEKEESIKQPSGKMVSMEIQNNNQIIKDNIFVQYQNPDDIKKAKLYELFNKEQMVKDRIKFNKERFIEKYKEQSISELIKKSEYNLQSNYYSSHYHYDKIDVIAPPLLSIKILFDIFYKEFISYKKEINSLNGKIAILTKKGKQNLDEQIDQINIWFDNKLSTIKVKLDFLKEITRKTTEDIMWLSKEYSNSLEDFNKKVIKHDEVKNFDNFFSEFPITNLGNKLSFLKKISDKISIILQLNIDKNINQKIEDDTLEIDKILTNSEYYIQNTKGEEIIDISISSPNPNSCYYNKILNLGDTILIDLLSNKSTLNITKDTLYEIRLKNINQKNGDLHRVKPIEIKEYIYSIIIEEIKEKINNDKFAQHYQISKLYDNIKNKANEIYDHFFTGKFSEYDFFRELELNLGDRNSYKHIDMDFKNYIENIDLSGDISNIEYS